MTQARDIGTGPTRKFGSALSPKVDGSIPTIPLVTERPIRLKSIGPCPTCGSKYHGCECEVSDDSTDQD